MDTSQRRELSQSMHRSLGSYELVLSPLLLALLGLWLDRTIDTTPLFTILFAAVGFAGACIKIYYQYDAEMSEHEANGPWVKRHG